MTIELDWGDADQRLVVMHIRGNWTGDELVHRVAQLQAMGCAASQNLELMVDMRNALNPPPNLVTLIGSILNRPLPQNIKQVVVISNTAFWKQIYSIVSKNYRNKINVPIIFVNSVDEAYEALECFKGMV
jgi:hypothetical protein